MIPQWLKETVGVLLLCAVFAFGYWVRGLQAAAKDSRVAAAVATATVQVQQHQASVTAKSDASATATAVRTQTVYRTITKEVTRYVASNPNSCALPAGWVQLHNDAAIGRLPASAGAVDAVE